MAKHVAEHLTLEEQFALRSESGELIWIGRIARPDSLYDASLSAQTFEEAEQAILNPNDSEEIDDVNLENATGDIKRVHIK